LGVDNPLKYKAFHNAGVEAARQPAVRIQAQETYKAHFDINPIQHALRVTHGVDNASQLPNACTWLNTPSACQKRHQTMKLHGSYKKSSTEDMLYVALCNAYGIDEVQRQVPVLGTRWAIDFYVKSIDTYIQLDGVYWHGLDRPIEVIAEHRTKRDVQIHRKWLTDREQDKWFEERGMKLVRITDRQFVQEQEET
jgi:very-short-patch-repair endonuclease